MVAKAADPTHDLVEYMVDPVEKTGKQRADDVGGKKIQATSK